MNKIINECNGIKDEVIEIRRYLHSIPEVGFNLKNTYNFVFNKLVEYGYKPIKCGKCGIVVDIGKGSKTILLRADLDALEMKEKSNVSFQSHNGYMHSCGHDFHTSILLGCAKVLKKFENELHTQIRLCFQPAEEILAGALDMINNDLLKGVDIGFMIHISVASDLMTGKVVLPNSGVIAPSCDHFEIKILGKGGHGAMPELCNDPLNVASHIILSLQQITSKEISMNDSAVITFGSVATDKVINAIPNYVLIKGTFRAYSNEIRDFIKLRVNQISKQIGKAFNCNVKVNYLSSCPCLINDSLVRERTNVLLKNLLKEDYVNVDSMGKNVGSEDFSYISNEIPTVMISLSAGSKKEGYFYPLHHNLAIFNEDCVVNGVKIFVYIAMKYFEK